MNTRLLDNMTEALNATCESFKNSQVALVTDLHSFSESTAFTELVHYYLGMTFLDDAKRPLNG